MTIADETVRRALMRDTMLTLAHDAEEVMLVVLGQGQHSAGVVAGAKDLFALAVSRLLEQATGDGSDRPQLERDWALRSQGYANAATILRFAAYMEEPVPSGPDHAGDLFRSALAELRPSGPQEVALDPLNEVVFTYRHVRGLRAVGRADEALRLASALEPEFFNAGGAQPRSADVQFEIGACLLTNGRPGQVFSALGELEEEYWQSPQTEVFSTRHRFGYILGLAEQAQGRTEEAVSRLEAALDHLRAYRLEDSWHDVYELSLALTLAELEALPGVRHDGPVDPIGHAETALRLAEDIQGRWGVIARTRTPLAVAFRRLYGDIALLVASLPPGPAAAALGLRVCLSAKQTGFAGHLRAGQSLLPLAIAGLVKQVLGAEQKPPLRLGASPEEIDDWKKDRDEQLADLREQIEHRVNPVLADMLLPVPAETDVLLGRLRGRSALDLTGLPDTLSGSGISWFRAFIEPSGAVSFESFDPGEPLRAYETAVGNGELDHAPWQELAGALLPAPLRERLAEASDDDPLEVVVSAHRELSLVPWSALRIGDGTRLVRRALLTHTPVLTCLVDDPLAEVTGPALVRLVSQAEETVTRDQVGVWTGPEQQAWDLEDDRGRIALSRCTLESLPPRAADHPQLSVALAEGGWGLVHIATHGHGEGLDQHLWIPEETGTGGLLTAGQALGMQWPASTLMASCDVGKVVNPEHSEPLGFVMAVLTGNGRCVVAAIDALPNGPAGRISAEIVRLLRGGGLRLDQALRKAQLAAEKDGEPVRSWALFNAYVR